MLQSSKLHWYACSDPQSKNISENYREHIDLFDFFSIETGRLIERGVYQILNNNGLHRERELIKRGLNRSVIVFKLENFSCD